MDQRTFTRDTLLLNICPNFDRTCQKRDSASLRGASCQLMLSPCKPSTINPPLWPHGGGRREWNLLPSNTNRYQPKHIITITMHCINYTNFQHRFFIASLHLMNTIVQIKAGQHGSGRARENGWRIRRAAMRAPALGSRADGARNSRGSARRNPTKKFRCVRRSCLRPALHPRRTTMSCFVVLFLF